MASTNDLASISNALSQAFEDQIVRQMNRETTFLRFLPKRTGKGKNLAWDAEFSGATATEYADAADVSAGEFSGDDTVPATLSWGLYRAALRVGGLAAAAARTSDSPADLRDLFSEKLSGSVSKLGSHVNGELFAGTGSNRIVGLFASAGPLDATGTYAGIARGTYSEWAGTKLANGGTPRAITIDLLRQVVRTAKTKGGSPPDVMVCDLLTHDKIAALFDTNRRWTDTVTTEAGTIKLRGGEQAIEFDGIPIVGDKDCTAGNLAAINTRFLDLRFLPTFPGQSNTGPNGTYEIGDGDGRMSGLPCRIEMLAKTGDSDRAFVKTYTQLRCTRPGAHVWLADLQTS